MKTAEINEIDAMLFKLSENRQKEVMDFIGYLIEKEKKHKAFVKRVRKAQKEPDMKFESVNEIMKAIREFEE